MKIEIWSDIACPWCFIGLNRFERALDAFDKADEVSVGLRSFQLDPGLPEHFDGTEVEYLAASKGIDHATGVAMTEQVASVGATDGLELAFDKVVVANSRRAHRVLQQAKNFDPSGRTAWALEQALFEAHFTNGLSIWDATVLTDLAERSGLPRDLAQAALDSPELDDAVAADIQQATDWGIHAVPTFIIEDRYAISGAQPAEAFAQALEKVWKELHPASTPPITDLAATPGDSCGVDGC